MLPLGPGEGAVVAHLVLAWQQQQQQQYVAAVRLTGWSVYPITIPQGALSNADASYAAAVLS